MGIECIKCGVSYHLNCANTNSIHLFLMKDERFDQPMICVKCIEQEVPDFLTEQKALRKAVRMEAKFLKGLKKARKSENLDEMQRRKRVVKSNRESDPAKDLPKSKVDESNEPHANESDMSKMTLSNIQIGMKSLNPLKMEAKTIKNPKSIKRRCVLSIERMPVPREMIVPTFTPNPARNTRSLDLGPAVVVSNRANSCIPQSAINCGRLDNVR